jgi:hypothetical protein
MIDPSGGEAGGAVWGHDRPGDLRSTSTSPIDTSPAGVRARGAAVVLPLGHHPTTARGITGPATRKGSCGVFSTYQPARDLSAAPGAQSD